MQFVYYALLEGLPSVAILVALGEQVESIADLEAAFKRAKAADRTYLIAIRIEEQQWTPNDAWWDVGVPEVSAREEVRQARADHMESQKKQRIGI